MENIARITSIPRFFYTTLCNCAALDFAGTMTDVTLKQQNQTALLVSFCKMANLKAFFYVAYSYTIFKYLGSIII